MKINKSTKATSDNISANKTQKEDSPIEFELNSKIEDSTKFENKIKRMFNDIVEQGDKVAKTVDIREFKEYRKKISNFMNEIVTKSHNFSRENVLDYRGRHKVYGIIKKVNNKLDKIAQDFIKKEKKNINVLESIEEIQGLILDIIT